jgi:hypothetical protein
MQGQHRVAEDAASVAIYGLCATDGGAILRAIRSAPTRAISPRLLGRAIRRVAGFGKLIGLRGYLATVVVLYILLPLTPSRVPSVHAQSDAPLDLVVVIDNSGSMMAPEYGQSDPQGLRYTATKLLIDLLSDQDRVAVVQFSDEAEPLQSQLTLVDTEQRRQQLKGSVDAASKHPPGETNYGKALGAVNQLFNAPSTNRRAVIFLTDGLPTDLPNAEQVNPDNVERVLAPFRDSQIPIFLTLLRNRQFAPSTTDIAAEIATVQREFRRTGADPIWIESPDEIAQGFTYVLTQLQPHTYLDTLTGVKGTGQSTHFEAQAAPSQALERVTLVLASSRPAALSGVAETATPANADRRRAEGPGYAILRYTSRNQQPLQGKWSIDVAMPDVKGFAFMRSSAVFDLVYPPPGSSTDVRWMIPNQPLLLGVAIRGLTVGSIPNVVGRLRDGACFGSGGGAYTPFAGAGVSTDGSVAWLSERGRDRPGALELRLSGLSAEPLRLSRCFTILPVPGAPPGALAIQRPTPADALDANRIPVEVRPVAQMGQPKVDAFVTDPSGRVQAVSLAESRGRAEVQGGRGQYTVRAVAAGLVNNLPVAQFAQTAYEVKSALALSEADVRLGPIREFGSPLADNIKLRGAVLSANDRITFRLESIEGTGRDLTDAQLRSLVNVELCPQGQIQPDSSVTCRVTVRPEPALHAGSYELQIKIDSAVPLSSQDRVRVTFERPPPTVSLAGVSPDGVEMRRPLSDNAVETVPLKFGPILFRGTPDLRAQVIELRDETRKVRADARAVLVELRQDGSADPYSQELSLRVAPGHGDALTPGHYALKLALTSSEPGVIVDPKELTVRFERPQSGLAVAFNGDVTRFTDPIWGLPWLGDLPGVSVLFPTERALALQATTQYLEGAPTLPGPTVRQIKQVGEIATVPSESLDFAWREDGRVPETTDHYRYLLLAKLQEPVAEGTYDVLLNFPGPITDPNEQVVRLEVLGWPTLLLWRLLPFVLSLIVLWHIVSFIRRRTTRSFRGALLLGTVRLPLEVGSAHRELQLALEDGRLVLVPFDGTGTVIVRCISQVEVEVDIPLIAFRHRLKRARSLGRGGSAYMRLRYL